MNKLDDLPESVKKVLKENEDDLPYDVKKLYNDNKDKTLRRKFVVALTDKEAETLRTSELKRSEEFINGAPALLRKRNGTYKAFIFKRFGIIYGSTVAKAKLEFTDPQTLSVSIKSGGIALGWSMIFLAVSVTLFFLSPYVFPEMKELIVNNNPLILVFVWVVFGFLAWLFLARTVRAPHLNDLELYLKDKIGGDWKRL